jgi:hypothetical protein
MATWSDKSYQSWAGRQVAMSYTFSIVLGFFLMHLFVDGHIARVHEAGRPVEDDGHMEQHEKAESVQ